MIAVETASTETRDEFRYARSGDVAIAYMVDGTGPPDIVFAHGFVGNIEIERETPFQRAFHDRVASFSRFILFDRHGTGLSDRPREPATLEARMDDVRAVLDDVGLERAVLFGTVEAAAMCALFAATYPADARARRVPRRRKGDVGARLPVGRDAGGAADASRRDGRWLGHVRAGGTTVRWVAPSRADDTEFVAAWARHDRLSASPAAAATLLRMMADVDIRGVLGAIRVPTLVAHAYEPREEADAAYIAERIPDTRRFEVAGPDYAVYLTADTLLPEVERFVEGLDQREPETVLATVLFTDIVGSTERLAEIGDAQWRELVERHHAVVRQQLSRFRGQEVDTAGDGFFARLDAGSELEFEDRGPAELKASRASGGCSRSGGRSTMEELRVEHDGVTLAATYSPADGVALVALHGANAGTREDPLYRHLHKVLPPAGIGAVTFDRRGEGESTGDPSVGRFEVQVQDALAVLDAIDASRIGLWGYSQGGWVAPLAAGASDQVAFLVLIASTGVTPSQQMMYAVERQLRLAGCGEAVIDRTLALRRRLEDWIHADDPARDEQLAAELSMAATEPWSAHAGCRRRCSTRKAAASGSRRWISTRDRPSCACECRRCSSTARPTPGHRSGRALQLGGLRAATTSTSWSVPGRSTT